MATYVICHGAWSGGWSWKTVRSLLAAAGHEVYAPSYTGLGERAHLANPMVGLGTHIQDIVNLIWFEDLTDVILIAHSYGGMVATGVGDALADRIRHLVYVDAFVPADGQSVRDLAGPRRATVDDWLVPHPGVATAAGQAGPDWAGVRHRHHPIACFDEKIRITAVGTPFPRSYIHCTAKVGGDVFQQFADRFRDDPAWSFHAMATSHSPNFTAPDALAALLLSLA
jgi:pimeloyl-ACP methyl ester carboxylesterase